MLITAGTIAAAQFDSSENYNPRGSLNFAQNYCDGDHLGKSVGHCDHLLSCSIATRGLRVMTQ